MERRIKSINQLPLPELRGSRGETYRGSLDPGIEDLVRVLTGLGYITQGSCEGHLDERKFPFPWVTILGLGAHRIRGLEGRIGLFNQQSDIKWTTISALKPRLPASDEKELYSLHQSAQLLAEFIFEGYLKSPQ